MNKLFICPVGTGKTQTLKQELAKSIASKRIVLAADPDGELCQAARNLKYPVKVLNLKDPASSDRWDLLKEVNNIHDALVCADALLPDQNAHQFFHKPRLILLGFFLLYLKTLLKKGG